MKEKTFKPANLKSKSKKRRTTHERTHECSSLLFLFLLLEAPTYVARLLALLWIVGERLSVSIYLCLPLLAFETALGGES